MGEQRSQPVEGGDKSEHKPMDTADKNGDKNKDEHGDEDDEGSWVQDFEPLPAESNGDSGKRPKPHQRELVSWADLLPNIDIKVSTKAAREALFKPYPKQFAQLDAIQKNAGCNGFKTIKHDSDAKIGPENHTTTTFTHLDRYQNDFPQVPEFDDRFSKTEAFSDGGAVVGSRQNPPSSNVSWLKSGFSKKGTPEVDPFMVQHNDKATISDEELQRCRLLNVLLCVEYGMVLDTTNGHWKPGLLMIIRHTLLPLGTTRITEADLGIRLIGASILHYEPHLMEDFKTGGMTEAKLHGVFHIGLPKIGSVDVDYERGHSNEQKYFRRIRGAGAGNYATYTLRENEGTKSGINSEFCSVLVLKRSIPLEMVRVRTEMTGTVGWRGFRSVCPKDLPEKNYGRRPTGFTIDEGFFSIGKGTGTKT